MKPAEDQASWLSILTRAPAELVKQFADELLPNLGPTEVLHNRTGLVLLPMADTVTGTTFYLGEVLLAEAHVQLAGGSGYGACLGRDLEQALALAVIDGAANVGHGLTEIAAFVAQQQSAQAEALLLRQVEATHVEMETF